MAVPKQHRSKSRQGQRRQHLFIKASRTVSCGKCAKPVLPHTMCANCGTYRGREMVDVFAKLSKKEQKVKAKDIAEGNKGELSLEKLSQK
ncbi:MAG: 50S ribosomal protein L32 [bacterium]|nr:50S ribosomal protein L32 [bacterium]